MVPLQPFIYGSGMAGQAVARALAILQWSEPDLPLKSPRFMSRETDIASLPSLCREESSQPLLILSNPPGLHAMQLVTALKHGIVYIFCEKPVCVNIAELEWLEQAAKDYPQAHIAVGHVYRQLWGPQTLAEWVREGKFGKLLHIESRFWQSSRVNGMSSPNSLLAKREGVSRPSPELASCEMQEASNGGKKLKPVLPQSGRTWISDRKLVGNPSIRLGLGTHWLDLVQFIAGEPLALLHRRSNHAHVTLSPDYETDAQDSFAHYLLEGKNSSAMIQGSIGNAIHGAAQRLEVEVIGTELSAHWQFNQPDEIILGRGREQSTHRRSKEESGFGSGSAPFHAMGWLEGYIDIFRQMARCHAALPYRPWPDLHEANRVHAVLLEGIKGEGVS